MTNRRQQLAARRLELVAQSEALRGQLALEAAALRHRLNVGARLLALVPLVRKLFARLRRR
jgi:hypothetical protein